MPLTALAVGVYMAGEQVQQALLPWAGIAALVLTLLSVLVWRVGSYLVDSFQWLSSAARALTHGGRIDPREAPFVEAAQLGQAFEHAAANLADANAALAEKSARLRNVLETAMDAIITTDDGGRMIIFNRAAEEMFRVPRGEAIGQPVDILLPDDARQGHLARMRQFASEPPRPRRLAQGRVITARRADGEQFRAEATISVTAEDDQRFYTVIMRDVTAREQQLRALMESNENLRGEVQRLKNVIGVLRGSRSTRRGEPG